MTLGQTLRPDDTNPTAIVTVTNRRITVRNITVANVTGNAVTYRIFRARSGESYDQDTAMFYDIPLDGNQTEIIELTWYLLRTGDNVAVRSSTASAITFCVDGFYNDA